MMGRTLRWPLVIGGMFLGYLLGGPLGGFAGLGLGLWFSRGLAHPRRKTALPEDIRSAYRTLGVKPKASNEAVRNAYRRLMNRHHPDKLGAADEEAMEQARQRTLAVRDAFERIRRRRGMH